MNVSRSWEARTPCTGSSRPDGASAVRAADGTVAAGAGAVLAVLPEAAVDTARHRLPDPVGEDQRPQRQIARSQPLRTGDHVRHHALLFETPEKMAHAPVTDLHFVGDAHAALGANQPVDLLQVARWQRDTAGIAVHRFADDARQLTATGVEVSQLGVDVLQVVGGAVGPAEAAAEGVRRFDWVYPVRAGFQGLRVVGDRRGDGIGSH